MSKRVKLLIIRARHDTSVATIPDSACIEVLMTGSNSLLRYWRETSHQYFDFTDTTLLPWVDITIGTDTSRTAVAALALAAAKRQGPRNLMDGVQGLIVLPFPGTRQIPNPMRGPGQPATISQALDGGTSGVEGLPVAVLPINTSDFTFMCHELGHVLGFNHSYGLMNNGIDWNNTGMQSAEYGSPYDLMSSAAFGSRWAGTPPYYNASPTFSLPAVSGWTGQMGAGPHLSRAVLHFTHPEAMRGLTVDYHYPVNSERFTARIWAPDQTGKPTLLVLNQVRPIQTALGRVYVEYRPGRGWDAGLNLRDTSIDVAGVVVHTVSQVTNAGLAVWYRGNIPTASIDRDLAVQTTNLVISSNEDPEQKYVDIVVTVGARPTARIDRFNESIVDSGMELPARQSRTPCFDMITVHSIQTVKKTSFKGRALGMGGSGPFASTMTIRWYVNGQSLMNASGQIRVPDSTQPLQYTIVDDVLTLNTQPGQSIAVDVQAIISDGSMSLRSNQLRFYSDGVREWLSDIDRRRVAGCRKKFNFWMRSRFPWIRQPIPDPPPFKKLLHPEEEIAGWKNSVRFQLKKLPGLTPSELSLIDDIIEIQTLTLDKRTK